MKTHHLLCFIARLSLSAYVYLKPYVFVLSVGMSSRIPTSAIWMQTLGQGANTNICAKVHQDVYHGWPMLMWLFCSKIFTKYGMDTLFSLLSLLLIATMSSPCIVPSNLTTYHQMLSTIRPWSVNASCRLGIMITIYPDHPPHFGKCHYSAFIYALQGANTIETSDIVKCI